MLQVPNASLGSAAPTRVWARNLAPVHGKVAQVDQAGGPGTNIIFNRAEADRAAFNETPPTHQLGRFGDRFVAFFRSLGYPEAEAGDLAGGLLPDALVYDMSNPIGYPNGRGLADDFADPMIAMLTRGRVPGDGVGPHTDLLDEFPYLGVRTRCRPLPRMVDHVDSGCSLRSTSTSS